MTLYVCNRCGKILEDKSDMIQIDMTFYQWQNKDEYWRYISKWKPNDNIVEICSTCRNELLITLSAFMKKGRKRQHGKTKLDTGNED